MTEIKCSRGRIEIRNRDSKRVSADSRMRDYTLVQQWEKPFKLSGWVSFSVAWLAIVAAEVTLCCEFKKKPLPEEVVLFLFIP